MDSALIERLAKVEVELRHLADDLVATRTELSKVNATASELRDVLQQAKGAKWLFLAMAAFVGFVASKLGTLTASIFGVK